MEVIYRVYTKVSSPDEFRNVQNNPEKATWWHDSRCHYSVVADVGEFVTEIFLDTDPTAEVKYPQLVCAEVQY